MHLQDIYIYPIKSLGGIRLSEAQVETRGFHLDRRWMLVDKTGNFLSQRTIRKMTLFQVQVESECLKVFPKQQPELIHSIPFESGSKTLIPVTVLDDKVNGQVVSQESDEWFSKMLGIPCQLVFLPLSSERPIQEKYAVNHETVSFADAMPYLAIGQASLDDLNEKLADPVSMNRFRPNLVFSGGEAFEEDHLDLIKIGECQFKITKPCARCVITTIDQDTAEKGKEPLRTLSRYRTVDKKVLFGQNLIALSTGTVKVGDSVKKVV